MPPGFDVTKLDTGMDLDDLGEVLAGTPAEMDEAVQTAVGLPYEQFTSCVVLPQGQFADFLHAKPATRQQILVNLLGLHVYERGAGPGHRPGQRRRGQAGRGRPAAGRAGRRLRRGGRGRRAAPGPDARADRRGRAVGAGSAGRPRGRGARPPRPATRSTRSCAALASVRTPRGSDEVAGATAAARASAAEAAEEVRIAEEGEEKVRGELAAAGDAGSLRLMLDRHAELDRLVEQEEWFAGKVSVAEVEFKDATAAAELAHGAHLGAAQLLEQARLDYTEAQRLDRAAALRAHLAAGDHCPVCEQTVTSVPADAGGFRGARRPRRPARPRARPPRWPSRAGGSATRWPASSRATWNANAPSTSTTCPGWPRCAAVVAGSPGVPALQRQLEELGVAAAQARPGQRRGARSAREAQRAAQAAVQAAEERQRSAWRAFDAGARPGGPVRPAARRPGRPGRRLVGAGRLGARASTAPGHAARAGADGRGGRRARGGRCTRSPRSTRCSPRPG